MQKENVSVLNRVNIIDYAVEGNRVKGAYGIGIENDTFYIIEAKSGYNRNRRCGRPLQAE